MKDCREYEPLIERMLAEEIGDAQREQLLVHAESCADCREYVDLHYQLQDPALGAELPTDSEFASMRRKVLDGIKEEQRQSRPAFGSFVDLLRAAFQRPAHAAALAAMLLVVLCGGLLAGSWWGSGLLSGRPELDDSMLTQIRNEAINNQRLTDVENSDYSYSNVHFRELNGNSVSLSFDVTRHIEVARRNDDPLVKEVLAQSLMNNAPISARMNALNQAGKVSDAKVEQALIFAMLNDPDLAVRLRALNVLVSYPPHVELQSAMIAVLSGEDSVQMRMTALDYLAASELSPARFDQVMDDLRSQEDTPLLIHAARYER